jgi:hypothetical protein
MISSKTQDVGKLAEQIANQLKANGVSQRCVSLAYGALSPDLRVNYEYGLVLGVDEFRQEQLYHLQKSYLHNRALHGYGTVYGLPVTTTPEGDDVIIAVGPGMGLDPYGRAIVIRHDQCARLKAWIEKQSDWSSHRDPSGVLAVCVTLSYDECADVLQPIAGQPCSSPEAGQAPARIRDSFNIQLSWDKPPEMPAWDAVRRFARLMADVEIVPGVQSDVETILELVRRLDDPKSFDRLMNNLDDPVSFGNLIKQEKANRQSVLPLIKKGGQASASLVHEVVERVIDPGLPFEPGDALVTPSGLPRRVLRLPAETARAELDRIFTVWTVEVRPRLKPDLNDPAATKDDDTVGPAILLASLAFQYDGGHITPAQPQPDYTGRPYLLHTQLIQELLLLGGNTEPQREFATLQARGNHVLRAWVHYPKALKIGQAALQLKSDGKSVAIQSVALVKGASNVFEIITGPGENNLIGSGARLALTFALDKITTSSARQRFMDSARFEYEFVGHDRSTRTITVFATASMGPREFATLQVRGGGVCHAWIDCPETLRVPKEALILTSDEQPLGITSVRRLSGAQNLFKIVTDPLSANLIAPGSRVKLSFVLDRLMVQSARGAVPLLPVLDQLGLNYAGRSHDTITVAALAGRIQATREWVTFETVPPKPGDESGPALVLWFHPNQQGLVSLPRQSGPGEAFKVWRQNTNQPIRYTLTPLNPVTINGRQYASRWKLTPLQAQLADDDQLSFSFYTDRILVARPDMPLTRLITLEQMAFIGYNGNRWIRVYYQVDAPPQPPEQPAGITIEDVRRELQAMPALPFVTITLSRIRAAFRFEFWFHLAGDPAKDNILVADQDLTEEVLMYGEFEQPPSPRPDSRHVLAGPRITAQHNVFDAILKLADWRELGAPTFLRFVFRPNIRLLDAESGRTMSLGDYITQARIKFEGYTPTYTDPNRFVRDAIVAYVRIPEEVIG